MRNSLLRSHQRLTTILAHVISPSDADDTKATWRRALARGLLVAGAMAMVATACSSSVAEDDEQQGPTSDVQSAVLAGIFIGSCIPDDGVNNYIEDFTSGDPSAFFKNIDVSCFQGKTNGCDAVTECTGVTADQEGPCSARCTGDVSESCDDGLRIIADCAVLGFSCQDRRCQTRPPGEACDEQTFMQRCDGTTRVECSLDETQRFDCADDGYVCGLDPDFGDPQCEGTGPACAFGVPAQCDGDAIVDCVGGKEHRVDCSARGDGYTCQQLDDNVFCGVAAECVPGNRDYESCANATTLQYCDGGRFTQQDCTSLGFTSCETAFDKVAICAPSPGYL